jgi:arylsulfatase A-like enzyme
VRALLLVLLAAVAPAQTERSAQRPPNILVLLADDHRPDAVGAFGNPHIRTPHLDALAARGFRFAHNYCMGSIHGAVCQPSRAMLLSGRTLYRVPMDLGGVTTLPQALAARGYATFATGKWHNGADSFLRCFQRGKAVMLGGMSDHLRVPLQDKGEDGAFGERRIGERPSSELFADAAIDFLANAPGESPFFAWVAFTAPHDPRQPPAAEREAYYESRPPLPANFMPQHPFDNGWMVGRDENLAPWPRPRSMIADQIAEYYGLITHMDAQIGRILAALERTGRAGDTIVVFTADHGLALGSHGLLGKQSVYEHSMGCPLIVAGPGIPRGRTDALTYLLDLHPTLCALAGADAGEGVEGEDLARLWSGAQRRVRDSLFLTYENSMRAVRDARWKLIRYPLIDHTQLFDLQDDPDELRDLARQPEHAGRVAAMTELLARWQQDIDDPHPLHMDDPRPMSIDLSGRARKPDAHQPAWIVEKYFK